MSLSVTADEYLDHRLPSWASSERAGHVRYDPVTRLVVIADRAIQDAVRPCRCDRADCANHRPGSGR